MKPLIAIFILTKCMFAQPDSQPDECCTMWYDGCNTCVVQDGVIAGCTMMWCPVYDEAYCINFANGLPDCAGVCGGDSQLDECGDCGGDNTSCGILGDVNVDFALNVLDIVLMVGFIVGNDTPTIEEIQASDVNEDGTLNVLDIVTLVSWILNDVPESNNITHD